MGTFQSIWHDDEVALTKLSVQMPEAGVKIPTLAPTSQKLPATTHMADHATAPVGVVIPTTVAVQTMCLLDPVSSTEPQLTVVVLVGLKVTRVVPELPGLLASPP